MQDVEKKKMLRVNLTYLSLVMMIFYNLFVNNNRNNDVFLLIVNLPPLTFDRTDLEYHLITRSTRW